jgi:hypothetical protein
MICKNGKLVVAYLVYEFLVDVISDGFLILKRLFMEAFAAEI